MLSPRRHRTRGASSLLLLVCCWLLAVAGLGAGEVVAVTSADARAEQAAAAAAHAAEAELAGRDDTASLSVALQARRTVCRLPDEPDAPPACAAVHRAAQRVARLNGAQLVDLVLGPDPRDRGAQAAPGRIVAVATVSLGRDLPLLRRVCAAPHPRSPGLCTARAAAAARMA